MTIRRWTATHYQAHEYFHSIFDVPFGLLNPSAANYRDGTRTYGPEIKYSGRMNIDIDALKQLIGHGQPANPLWYLKPSQGGV